MIDAVADEIELLERHLDVLATVAEHYPIGIVNLEDETGYPRHQVRYSLRKLEESSIVEPTDHGAVPTGRASGRVEEHGEELDDVIARLERVREEATA